MIHIEVHEDKLSLGNPKFRIRLPAIPLRGDTITLPDDHYKVAEVYHQANVPEGKGPGDGYIWPDNVYYTIRMVVRRKLPGE